MKKIYSQFELSDMLITYVSDESGKIGLELIPVEKKNSVTDQKNYEVAPLVEAFVRGDDFSSGYSNGHSMRNSQSTHRLKFEIQHVAEEENGKQITTVLKTETGCIAKHILTYRAGTKAIRTKTIYCNESDNELSLEMLSSFAIGGITPFVAGEAQNSMVVHRIRSCWSAEGRLVSTPLEELQLEPSWSRGGIRIEKFGQIGSMPVRNYFPFVAVEDTVNKTTWAVQVACASSWQIELFRRDDALSISGGLADYDFGHWMKILSPHEQIETPEAILTVGCGGVDSVSQRLLSAQELSAPYKNQLPVIFNEFCTTWGKPTQENIAKIVDVIKSKDIQYFVIDSGWFMDNINDWDDTNGDWIVSDKRFPDGLKKTVDMIKQAGMIPGIWFEFETCGKKTELYHNEDHLLKRNGTVITTERRRFLDMRDPWVNEYLTEKVISMLKKYGFEYIKVDYNDTIGVGCDGAESLGEGLRQNILAAQKFFQKIKAEVPGVIIENCSSGGHRLEPSMMSLCDIASFSDAHECKEIPIIAANLHRVIQPGKSQIWAVLRKDDSLNRIVYSMVSTFLGVMCLSGDIYDLNAAQWELVEKGINFYNSVSHLIASGQTKYFGTKITSYRFPEGWQGIVRYSENKSEAIVLIHTFSGTMPDQIQIPLEGIYEIKDIYSVESNAKTENNLLTVPTSSEFEATAVYLKIK
jgi:alpha-galactosidase